MAMTRSSVLGKLALVGACVVLLATPGCKDDEPPMIYFTPGAGGGSTGSGSPGRGVAGRVDGPDAAARDGGGGAGGARGDAAVSGDGGPRVCNLLTQNCDRGLGCYPTGQGGTGCFPAGNLGEGAQCTSDTQTDCAAGSYCAPEPGQRTNGYCRRLCSTTAKPEGCNRCVTFDPRLPEFGWCEF